MKFLTVRLIAMCCAFVASTAQAGPFAAPAEGPVPFRRDRLPLDVDAMTRLAAELVTLTGGLNSATPTGRRTAAQFLALTLALDPANQPARATIDLLTKGETPPSPRSNEFQRAATDVWTTLSWLETPAADTDGQALAACLSDVMTVADPTHPRAKAAAATGERGAWSGWIPDLRSFEKKVSVAEKTPDEDTTTPEPEITPPGTTAAIRLKEATLHTPLWNYDPTTKQTTLLCLPVSMKVKVDPPDETTGESRPFRLHLDKTEATDATARLNATLVKAISNLHSQLPQNTRISLTIGDDGSDYLPASNGHAISAAAALLMNAALSGVPPEATVIGVIDESGAFKLPTRFWEKFRALENGPGGKLVMPTAAADYLPSLLALEQSEFFFKYEVLLASNFDELIARTTATPADASIAAASAAFAEIRERIGNKTVPQYVSNSFIRQRLATIAQENPHHFSARMLSIQGAGERPTLLPRHILASELRSAIIPMSWIGRDPEAKLSIAAIDATYNTCRTAVDDLDRYVDRSDRELQEKVRSLTNSIRSLSRTARAPVRDDGDARVANRAAVALQKSYQTLRTELAAAAGDEEPANPPIKDAPPPS